MGLTTVSKLVPETCEAIWHGIQPVVMCMPQNAVDWQHIASDFQKKWNFPHCIGAIDGKHVIIHAPNRSGSIYYNYKGTFSVVLLALVDASYKFISVDIGAYGHQSDAGIFSNSELGRSLAPPNSLHLPNDSPITDSPYLDSLPYVVVGDEAFPLQRHVLRPYPGRNCSEEQLVYNYRHSRARRIVECAFGILAARWRVFHTKIACKVETVVKIIKATTVLHNMLQSESTPNSEPGDLDGIHADGLKDLRGHGTRGTKEASQIRDAFMHYFVANPLSWQNDYVRRGLTE